MKKILITGATDGIGLETVKSLAGLGHQLLIHGRNEKKLDDVKGQLQAINSNVQVNTYLADLSDLSQVVKLAEQIKQQHQDLDIIINNAGVLKSQTPITASGLDVRFVVNTLSPYLLTQRLLPLLTAQGRVVNLSSAAQASVDVKALVGDVNITDDMQAYAQSKLAITLWTQELAKTLKPEQVIVAVNPGSLLASKMVKEGFGLAGNDLSIGSDILVKAALSSEFSNASGKYFDNDSKQFSNPHFDFDNAQKCQQLMLVINKLVADV